MQSGPRRARPHHATHGGHVSYVTNAIFTYSILEKDRAREADLHLATARVFVHDINDRDAVEDCWHQYWLRLDDNYDAYGGSKAMETQVFVAAFNYFDDVAFMAEVATIPWEHPAEVQLIAMRQEDDRWHIYHLPGIVPPLEELDPLRGCTCCRRTP